MFGLFPLVLSGKAPRGSGGFPFVVRCFPFSAGEQLQFKILRPAVQAAAPQPPRPTGTPSLAARPARSLFESGPFLVSRETKETNHVASLF